MWKVIKNKFFKSIWVKLNNIKLWGLKIKFYEEIKTYFFLFVIKFTLKYSHPLPLFPSHHWQFHLFNNYVSWSMPLAHYPSPPAHVKKLKHLSPCMLLNHGAITCIYWRALLNWSTRTKLHLLSTWVNFKDACINFDDDVLGLFLLITLPDSWETFRVSMSSAAPNGVVPLQMTKTSALNEEMRRKAQGISSQSEVFVTENRGRSQKKMIKGDRDESRNNSRSRYKNVECHYCHRTWHIQRNYFLWKKESR